MRQFGLIGYPLSHSFSKSYFTEKFAREGISDAVYENFPIPSIEEFPGLLDKHPNLAGLNVTIPYKQLILSYLQETDDTAASVGAVNTIKITRTASRILLKGYNTDVFGFEETLKENLQSWHTHALVLGSGGASRAVLWVLKKLRITATVVSRSPRPGMIGYISIDRDILQKHLLIINCTPSGMYPNTDQAPPLPYQFLTNRHFLYDLIYNPEETKFLRYGKDAGAVCRNGMEMLKLQAEKAWEIWNTNESIPKESRS